MKTISKFIGGFFIFALAVALFSSISPIILIFGGLGIWYYIKKEPNPKKMKASAVAAVIGLFGCFILLGSNNEDVASETTTATAEKTSEEIAAVELYSDAMAAIASVEKWPSRSNYNSAFDAMNKLDKPSQNLIDSFSATEEKVIQEEENIKLVEAAVELAETNLTRESYENAKASLANTITRESDFSNRLIKVENTIKEKEAAELEAAANAIKAQEQAAIKDPNSYRWDVSYDALARTPDDYKGQKVAMTGRVVQVMEGSGTTQLRIAVNNDYDTVVFVEYDSSIAPVRILEDDYVNVYGDSYGLYSYSSTMGGKITIPGLVVNIIQLN